MNQTGPKWEEITIPDVIELQEPTIPAQIERSDIEQITRRDRIENTDNFIEQREQLFVNTTTDSNLLNTYSITLS